MYVIVHQCANFKGSLAKQALKLHIDGLMQEKYNSITNTLG